MKMLWLDVDGVFCDFAGAVINEHNRRTGYDSLHVNDCHMHNGLAKLVPSFYEVMYSPGFWQRTQLYPGAQDVFYELRELTDNWRFLTSVPPHAPTAFYDKAQWLDAHLGSGASSYMVTAQHKEDVVHPGDLLVDDYDQHLLECLKKGAHAICVARPWNQTFQGLRVNLEQTPTLIGNWLDVGSPNDMGRRRDHSLAGTG